MIRKLDNKDLAIAEEIVKLQKASYKVEADLIGFAQIPPLLEDAEDIMNSKETYYGYYVGEKLAGIISYIIEDNILDIYKVAVHPDFFKRGIATQLVNFIHQTPHISKMIVATGLKNSPAVKLYTALGFKKLAEIEVEKGLYIVSFEKHLSKTGESIHE